MNLESVGIAIKESAEQLPAGWNLMIDIERGSVVIILFDDEGDSVDNEAFDALGDLSAEIRNAVAHACASVRDAGERPKRD